MYIKVICITARAGLSCIKKHLVRGTADIRILPQALRKVASNWEMYV